MLFAKSGEALTGGMSPVESIPRDFSDRVESDFDIVSREYSLAGDPIMLLEIGALLIYSARRKNPRRKIAMQAVAATGAM